MQRIVMNQITRKILTLKPYVNYEDILASMDKPVELGANDEDPEFLKVHLNSFSFDNVRNEGRKAVVTRKMLKHQ
jgi:hypothetical protein